MTGCARSSQCSDTCATPFTCHVTDDVYAQGGMHLSSQRHPPAAQVLHTRHGSSGQLIDAAGLLRVIATPVQPPHLPVRPRAHTLYFPGLAFLQRHSVSWVSAGWRQDRDRGAPDKWSDSDVQGHATCASSPPFRA
eukprot:scaffold1654_cov340-Prasinococcus_capsulatus_cf.AAC.8